MPHLDLHDPAFLSGDRTPAYRMLREQQPVWHMPENWGPDTWVVSRYVDVQLILRVPENRVQMFGTDAPPWVRDPQTRDRLRRSLAQADAPIHGRLKRVLTPLFMPRRLEMLRDIAAESVQRAIAAVSARCDSFEAVYDFAAHMPKGVLCHLLGIPEQDWGLLMARQHDYLAIFSLFPLTADESARLDGAVRFFREYFGRLYEHADPAKDSLLVAMLREAETAGELDREEVLALMHTVLDAGSDTTRTSISNAMELLACEPGLLDQLRSEPGLIDNAVEELLRVRSAVHVRHRFLAEPFRAHDGTVIPQNALVLVLLASANQDGEVFEQPERIDFRRSNASRHVAFGGGLHHCLGAPLARIQLQETLKGLARAYRRIELKNGLGPRYASLKFPALSELHVSVEPATLP